MEDFVFMCKVGRERVEGKIEANSKLRTHWQNQSVSGGISCNPIQNSLLTLSAQKPVISCSPWCLYAILHSL